MTPTLTDETRRRLALGLISRAPANRRRSRWRKLLRTLRNHLLSCFYQI